MMENQVQRVIFAWLYGLVTIIGTVISIVSLTEDSASTFRYEPRNATVAEGEAIKFNCSRSDNDLPAIWIINGIQYTWLDFDSISEYTFDIHDNSLTINNAPRNLNGTSFQCIINRKESQIGYLTVTVTQSVNKSASYHGSQSTFVTSVTIMTEHSIFSSSADIVPHISEEPTQFISNITTRNSWIVAVTATVGTVVVLAPSLICTCLLIKKRCHPKSENDTPDPLSAPEPTEIFTMVTNELYGKVECRCNMTKNKSYNQRSSYLAG